jgi:hypothetical protein
MFVVGSTSLRYPRRLRGLEVVGGLLIVTFITKRAIYPFSA